MLKPSYMKRSVYWFLLVLLPLAPSWAQEGPSTPTTVAVYFFLAEDCVICQQYTPYLNQLYAKYAGPQVEMVGYFPNQFSKKQTIAAFQQKYEVQMPLKTDFFQTKMEQFGVRVTPEVVVFDPVNERVLYQGRIDNTFYQLGRRRTITTSYDLEEALKAILTGEEVANPKTQPVGCFITRSASTTQQNN